MNVWTCGSIQSACLEGHQVFSTKEAYEDHSENLSHGGVGSGSLVDTWRNTQGNGLLGF